MADEWDQMTGGTQDEADAATVTEQQVRLAAADVFTPAGIDLWMGSRNQMLDGRSPRQLIAAGEGQRVLDLIDFLASGSFA